MRIQVALIALLVVVSAGGVQAALADEDGRVSLTRVLAHTPEDASLVVVVPSIEGFAGGMRAFGERLGSSSVAGTSGRDILTGPFGAPGDVLDTAGPLVMAVSAAHADPVLIGGLGALADWTPATPASSLPAGVQIYEQERRGWLAVVDNTIAILARSEQDLMRAVRSRGEVGARLAEAHADWLRRQHLVLHVDVKPWRAVIHQQMAVVSQGAYMGMAASGPDAQTALQLWEWVLEQFELLVSEMETYALSARVGADGIRVEDRAAFRPGGRVVGYLSQVKRSQRDLLRGLSREMGAAVFAAEWELPPNVQTLDEAMVKAMLKMDLFRDKAGDARFQEAMQKSIELYRKMSGYSGMFSRDPDGEGMVFSGVYLTRDGQAVRRGMRSVIELCPDLMAAWGSLPGTSVRHEVSQVGQGEGDMYRFDVDQATCPRRPTLQSLYGQDTTLYMAEHPEGVVYAMGSRAGSEQVVENLAQTPRSSLRENPRVAALLRRFTPRPQACLLLDLPEMMGIVADSVRQQGGVFPPMPRGGDGTALVGFTFYLEPAAIRSEVFVPTQPIRMMREAFDAPGAAEGKE